MERNKLKKEYIKIPYNDENLTIELRVYHEINKIIKRNYKKGVEKKCSFAKKYSFTTSQVKNAMKCSIYPFYNNLEEDIQYMYQHIKKIPVYNIRDIVDKFLYEISKNYDIIFQKFGEGIDYVNKMWERIRQGLEYMINYQNSANTINHLHDTIVLYVEAILGDGNI